MPTAESHARRTLQILHLEDTVTDRELIRFQLQSEGLRCHFTYADTRGDFEAALTSRTFDLILSDFTIPGYHGAHALAFAHEKCPDTPYVFISGTIGEERAIESLKAGATDYVLKERLDRLVPAVRRALREAEDRAKHREVIDALRASEERFREMAETIHDVFWMATIDVGRYLYVSPAYAGIWQRPVDALYSSAESWIEAVVDGDRDRLSAARAGLTRGAAYDVEYRIRRPDGSLKWIEERGYATFGRSGRIKGTVGVATDITERKQLQEQLIQAQKIEAIGMLAGGIAHDFNNVLSVINGYAQILMEVNSANSALTEPLKQIYAAGRRAANLTRQLLVFSRRQTMNEQVVDLNAIVDDLAKMLARLIGERVQIRLELGTELPRVRADASMMEQIIVNLAVNARDAMPEGGKLTISTSHVIFRDGAPRPSQARSGDYVRLSVRDTGCGISPANLARIFEPFFTTKPTGQGTGLGLATVQAVVQQHHGWTEVASVVNEGTVFDVFLPAIVNAPTAQAISAAVAARGGSETILLVEDEAAVRACAADVLQRYGYRILQAGTATEAIDLWQRHESEIDLLLTDVVLPDHLTGFKLAEALRAGRAQLRVIVASGYPNDTNPQAIERHAGTRFIYKPYDVLTLTRTVREVLDLKL